MGHFLVIAIRGIDARATPLRVICSPMETVLLVILAAAFGGAGIAKLAGVKMMRDNFERWPTPAWSRYVVGAIEVGIAVAAVIGLSGSGDAQQLAALLALWVMVGAIVVHAMAGDKLQEVAPALVLLFCAALLLFTQQT
ncbi:MAG: DoxX family protein [Solirubrobacteraceae bacterium]|nr:DoxX family protein [Solirubrobacteraceae bacterium]